MTKKQQEEIDLLKELIALDSTTSEDRETFQKTLSKYQSEEPKVEKKTMPKKAKATRKPKASPKPKAEKSTTLPSDVDAMKKAIKERTGKTEEECEDIISQYRILRNKAKVNSAKRTERLKSDDKLIAGTNVITPVAQIEKDAEIVKVKIEKQVEQIENKAEREVVTKDKTKDEVKIAVEKKVIKELAKLSDDMVLKSTTFVKNIQTELKKVDKTEAKNFLLGLRNEIDALLSKFGDGGSTIETYNITENESASSVNPSLFARGGGVFAKGKVILFEENGVGGNKNKTYQLIKFDYTDGSGDEGFEIREMPTNTLMGQGNNFKDVLDSYNLFIGKNIEYARGGGVKNTTNEARVKALIKSLDNTPYSIGLAILRERLLTYTQNDLKIMEENPSTFDNFFISNGMYRDYFNRVIEELKFDYEDGGSVDNGDFANGGGINTQIYQEPINNLNRRLKFINEDINRVFKYAPKELLDFKVEGWEDIGTLLSNIEIASDLTDNASDDWRGSKINMATGGGVEDIDYNEILEVLKEKLEDSIQELPMDYENSDDFKGEEVEHESRDGFIPYTDGGYEVTWFEFISQFSGSGKSLPTSQLDDEMQRQVDYNYESAKERFVEEYAEIVEELGEDNIDYHSLYEAGYGSEAEQLSEWENDYDGDDTILCEIGAYYYDTENYRGIDGKNTIRLYGLVNLESPYHRRGNLDDSYDIDITFDSISELKEKIDAGLKEITNWFAGKYYKDSNAEMKITRMADGGSIDDGDFAKGGGVGKKYILLGYSATASRDSYEDGELESVGDWNVSGTEPYGLSKEFSNKKDLIDYINEKIIYVDDYQESDFDWESGEGKNIQTDVLCSYDDYNGYFPASEEEKKLWKKGKKDLFNVHYFINVQAVIPTSYKTGGEVGEFALGGGVTTNEGIINAFLNDNREMKVGNITTHYSTLGNVMLLRNYGTLIAKRNKFKVSISNKKYSKTTSAIQNLIFKLANMNGNEVEYIDEDKFADGGLIGNQKRIDLNENGKIDAEDFKLLRSTRNAGWRKEHKYVNSTSRNKKGKLDKSEVRYAKKNNPSRTGYKGKTNYAMGGDISHYVINGEVFIDYMDAVNYADQNNLSTDEIKKTKEYAKGGMLKPRLKKGDDVLIIGRRWFDKVNGNTYHTAELQVNGNFIAKSGMQYGYGDNYVETGKELLLQNYKLPIGFNEKSPLYQLRDKKITFRSFAYDGLKRDLAKGGGIDGVPQDIKERLEYLRGEIRNESISYEELIELQSLAQYIEPNDVELLEQAGVPEFEDEYVSSCNVCGNDKNSSEMSDMDNVCKSCIYAKGGKVGEFKNIMENNIITEKEINLIKMRMNNNRVDESTQEVIDYIWDNSPELTPDQNKKGIDYLRNLWKSPTGKERTNNPFRYREQEALDTFQYFELRGFYDAGNYNNKFYVPLYNCVGADSSFEYAFYGGKVNILG